MENLLKEQFLDYLISLRKNACPMLSVDKDEIEIRSEITTDSHFDIIDKKDTIIVDMGDGSATYSNLDRKTVAVVDYENFINKLPVECSKNIKRADFLLYNVDGTDFFIINELSQSSDPKGKRNDAKMQLANAVKHLLAVKETSDFIAQFDRKICIFSNKDRLIETPLDSIKAFEAIKEYLPDPIPIKFQPITKAGFDAIETATYSL